MRHLISVLLLTACTATIPEGAAVLLDPEAVDLGRVYPTQGAEAKLVVANVRDFATAPMLESIQVSGDGAEWVLLRPIVALPASLAEPMPVEIEAQIPSAAPAGPYTVLLTATGRDGDEPFTLIGRVDFDVGRCDVDGDGDLLVACGGGDCDDEDPAINSAAIELCNGVDDDCNGLVDDAADLDGDGFVACDDCDDTDPLISPVAMERCNGLDDNCDGRLGAGERDNDGDGFAVCDGDCDDLDNRVFPGAVELCNGIDDDCDGIEDDAEDADDDSFTVCEDCDDADRFTYPGAPEQCDGLDNDCDGELPESERDGDGDGVRVCDLDCDDTNPSVFPGAREVCNGADDDCDEEIDEGSSCPCDRVADEGNVYLFCTTGEFWTDAQRTCAGWGYHLLTVDDAGEDEFAFDEVRRVDGSRKWWTGYNDLRSEGTWVWEDGTPSGYENWGSGEPNDSGGGEDCGQLNRYTDGTWNDEPCDRAFPYVCELF